MVKIDFKKELKDLYNASTKIPSIIEVPRLQYIKIDGHGLPTEEGFQNAAGTLYPIAYTIKFLVREIHEIDYGVLPMEVIWHVNREKKGDFHWTMMLMQPQFITNEIFEQACDKVRSKFDIPLMNEVRFESDEEGVCVQVLHKGDYKQMNNTLDIMLEYITGKGYISGRDTHDIYLNDIRKTKTENLKTIMRLSVKR